MTNINFWPILVASLVSFAIGSLWYSPVLFGKEWMALTKISDKDINDTRARGVWKLYIVQFIFTLIMFCVIGFTIATANIDSSSDGGFVGFLAWLGFVVPMQVSGFLWKRHSFKLVLIESINYLVTLVIGGAIIGAWR